jgi:hypothetical protein
LIEDIQGLPNFIAAVAIAAAVGLFVFELVVDYFKGVVSGF